MRSVNCGSICPWKRNSHPSAVPGEKKKRHMRSNICQSESCFLTSVPQTCCTLAAVTPLILARFKLSYSKVSVSARRYNYSCHLHSGSYVPFFSCICLLCLQCPICRCLALQITDLWTKEEKRVMKGRAGFMYTITFLNDLFLQRSSLS